MICRKNCPKGTKCKPIANVVADDNKSFVCVGFHGEEKPDFPSDIFRHCFFNQETDTTHDYDEYDMLSVVNVFSEALLINKLTEK